MPQTYVLDQGVLGCGLAERTERVAVGDHPPHRDLRVPAVEAAAADTVAAVAARRLHAADRDVAGTELALPESTVVQQLV